MNVVNVAFVCALFISVGVSAQQAQEMTKPSEVLKVPPYPSDTPWKEITNKKNDKIELVEWIPADQKEEAISDILTKQVFYTSKGESPAKFVAGLLKRIGNACEDARVNGPKDQTENGYAVAYAQAYCTNQKGAAKDVDIFIKAIGGADALYVVQREFRRPAQPGAKPGVTAFANLDEAKARLSAQSTANKFLVEQVQLCPPTGGTGACAPAGEASTPTATTAPANPPASAPAAPATSPNPTATSPDIAGASFVAGTTTADEVKATLGKPTHEDHNPDGRFVYVYSTPTGDRLYAYLFDSKGILTRIRGFEKN